MFSIGIISLFLWFSVNKSDSYVWVPVSFEIMNTQTNGIQNALLASISTYHWNENVVILTKFSSLAALEFVILTTFSAASDENFIKMKTFPFQWRADFIRNNSQKYKSIATTFR